MDLLHPVFVVLLLFLVCIGAYLIARFVFGAYFNAKRQFLKELLKDDPYRGEDDG